MQGLIRFYAHYEDWEEYRWGMWRIITGSERQEYFDKVRTVLLDVDLFTRAMRSALLRWPVSCKVNLSNRSMNRAAWLWHAGACVVTGAPEDVTRSVWPTITDEQRTEADRIAWALVEEWESAYGSSDDSNLHLSRAGLSHTDQTSRQVLQETCQSEN